MNTYEVNVTREGGRWLANVPAVAGAHTYAKTLTALRRNVREVIALMADYPDSAVEDEGAFEVKLRYRGLGRTTEHVRRLREQIAKLRAELEQETPQALQALDEQGLSVRDEAEVLGVSPQRVHQLRHELQDA